MVTVSFPVESHVRKYLNLRYGNVHIATKRTVLGSMIIHCLSEEYIKHSNRIEPNYKYSVLIPKDDFYRRGHSLTQNKQQYIGACCTRLFNEAMCEYLDMAVRDGKKALPSLKIFLKHYFISEDDVKVETLYKTYQRHCRMSIKAKNNIQSKN